MFSSATSAGRFANTGASECRYSSKTSVMGTVTNWMLRFFASVTASALLPSDENGPGMETPSTFSPESIHRDRCHHGGINSPAQSDEHFFEAAFLDVVVRPGDQRAIGIGNFFVRQRVEFPLPRSGVEQYEVLLKRKCLCGDFAVRGQRHAGPVKNEAVVTPNLIHVDDRAAMSDRDRPKHFKAQRTLVNGVGRS